MHGTQQNGLDMATFENRQLATDAKFINKSSLFILLPGVTHRMELKLISEIFLHRNYAAGALLPDKKKQQ